MRTIFILLLLKIGTTISLPGQVVLQKAETNYTLAYFLPVAEFYTTFCEKYDRRRTCPDLFQNQMMFGRVFGAPEGKWEDDKMVGEWNFYSVDGVLRVEENYKNGHLDGERKEYYYNGVLRSRMTFENGKLQEVLERRDINDQLLEVGNYKNGEGVFVDYYANGNRFCETTVKNYMDDGEAVFYYPSGELWLKGTFSRHKEKGAWIEFDLEGNELKRMFFIDGVFKGEKFADGRR